MEARLGLSDRDSLDPDSLPQEKMQGKACHNLESEQGQVWSSRRSMWEKGMFGYSKPEWGFQHSNSEGWRRCMLIGRSPRMACNLTKMAA